MKICDLHRMWIFAKSGSLFFLCVNEQIYGPLLRSWVLGKLDPSEEVKQRFASFLPPTLVSEKEIAAAGEERC